MIDPIFDRPIYPSRFHLRYDENGNPVNWPQESTVYIKIRIESRKHNWVHGLRVRK